MLHKESCWVNSAFLAKDAPVDQFTPLGCMLYKAPSDGKWGEHEFNYLLFTIRDVNVNPNPNEDCFNKSKSVQWNQWDSQECFQVQHEPAYIPGEEDGEKEFSSTIPSGQGNAQRPEVRIVTWNNDELATDALPVQGFEHYKAKDYSLAHALFSGSNYAGGQWKS